MSKSINKVILIGNVGQDPKIAILTRDKKVANFSLATNRQWKDQYGKDHDDVDWHRCSAWGNLADIIEEGGFIPRELGKRNQENLPF